LTTSLDDFSLDNFAAVARLYSFVLKTSLL
jgi:hypothetical protein